MNEVLSLLENLNITCTLYRHEPVLTMADCSAVDEVSGGMHCKNLFLTTRNGERLFMVLLRADKTFRTAEISKQLGASRLSFCTPEKLWEVLKLKPGAVNPFALLNDTEKQVTLAIDKDIKGEWDVSFHPNSNEATVKLSYSDFEKVLKHMGREPLYITAGEAL